MDEGVETEAALYRNGIPVDFSEETLAQTKQLPTAVSAQDKIGRVDITSKLPSASIFISQVIHRRSTSGLIEHKPFESSSGNKITRILGDYMDEGVETEAALYRNGIPVDFSEET
jgi:exoribonuclease R